MTWVSPPPRLRAELTCRMRIASVEVGQQFFASDGCGADLADGNACRMIRENSRLLDRRATGAGERQRCDHRIARAGNVEHFAGECWQMLRSLPIEQRHPFFAARDQ